MAEKTVWVPMSPVVRARLDKAAGQLDQSGEGAWGSPCGDLVNTMLSLVGIHGEQFAECIWSDADIRTALKEQGLAANDVCVQAAKDAWYEEYGQDLADYLESDAASRGWDAIEEAVGLAVLAGKIEEA